MAQAFFSTEPQAGITPALAVSASSTPAVTPGKIVRMKDPTYGEGEFIYLTCLSGQTLGQLVTFTVQSAVGTPSHTAVALTTSTKNQARPVAVAMAANATGAANFGWFAIGGSVLIKKTALKVSPGAKVFLGTTSGRIGAASGSGKQVLNAITTNTATVASATSTVLVYVNRPFLQGQII